jgi:hypothetical protein
MASEACVLFFMYVLIYVLNTNLMYVLIYVLINVFE